MRRPTSTPSNKETNAFINAAEEGEQLKRGRPKSGVKTKAVTISCTKDDLKAMDDVIELALNVKDPDGKRIKISQSESVRLGFEAVKIISKESPEMFQALLDMVKTGR
ncbi:hypothetical protein Sps_04742 [Shewanella psychrophila]|uniref:Uncharacterized protein n=1 Tax=Shewanella psychrophila TaxID=225848 RepID=A0A1S6HW92_9GAMM|nr:hypothetical protein [Shewanella psychrophila]AQS39825.1 hypothetical protein Sps_04742 [Shewanella psychrophila]